MPQQLIYTSAPRGIVAGRSGHCTVARSASMREALMLQLEKLSYYQHLSLSGGRERPIFACRMVDIRGSRFHVLSRLQDAGLDFTGRTNFVAHHLVFAPEEVRQFSTPPVILRDWPGWMKAWAKEPQLLENEAWAELTALSGKQQLPAQTWQRVTGEAVNGYGLLEARAGASFGVDELPDETILGLLAESLELLEIREPRRDFRGAAWNYTFTTSMQEQDNPADFRWRCLHSDNPAANRFAPPDCRALSAVRAAKWTGEETAFAKSGRQAPRFVVEPQDVKITEGQAAKFTAKAEGVPNPSYQWFSVDRANNGQVLTGATSPELVVSNPALGVSRYVVKATNSADDIRSKVATLSVEQKLKLAQAKAESSSRGPAKSAPYQKSEEEIEGQRRRIAEEKAQKLTSQRRWRNRFLIPILAVVAIVVAGVFARNKFASHRPPEGTLVPTSNATEGNHLSSPVPPLVAVPPTSQPSPTQNMMQMPDNMAEQPRSNQARDMPGNLPLAASFPLPAGWTEMAIGRVISPKSEFISPRFDLYAVADGFFTNGDNIIFVCKTNEGGEFKATIPAFDRQSPLRRCGIMARETRETNAPFLFIGVSLDRIFAYSRNNKRDFFFDSVERPQSNQGRLLFLKLAQEANAYSPAYSFDNKSWRFLTNCELFSTQQMFVGFALYSGDLSKTASASFVVDYTGRPRPQKKEDISH